MPMGDKGKLLDGDERILHHHPVEKGKVGIVTAGGSGHLPVFLGYVGQGMLDGCAVGNVFASPSAKKMADMIKACDHGSGVLCLYGNYGGDNMNFDMACEMVEMDDVETMTVRVKDDVASSPKETMEKRRGVAGMVYGSRPQELPRSDDEPGGSGRRGPEGAGQYPHHGRCPVTMYCSSGRRAHLPDRG